MRPYFSLIKSPQTTLLLLTGLAGYSSARCPVMNAGALIAFAAGLFLAIGGSTILNMVYDRDIDARMARTCRRPLPSGRVGIRQSVALGTVMSAAGVMLAAALSPLCGALVLAGVIADVAIYTVWLKRRTPWSIVWGGVSGGMPVLAGRALGVGQVDGVGIALMLTVILWIPTHILTFHLRHSQDYERAGIPTVPSRYGPSAARYLIALSSVGAVAAMAVAATGLGMAWGYLRLLAVLGVGLVILALRSLAKPSERLNFGLFKYASLFLLGAMGIVVAGTVG